MKKTACFLTIAAFMALAFIPASVALAEDQPVTIDDMGGFTNYYQNHMVSVDDLINTWGKPVKVVKCENGAEKYFFRIRAIENDEIRFVVKDGKVVGCQ